MEDFKYGEYEQVSDLIRVRTVEYDDPEWGDECLDYCFEVFKRPFFWGLIGKKRWEESMQTNSYSMGLSFSKYLLGIK